MVITINSTEDFLRVLRENEEFRIAPRRELLTDDLLKLPLEFSEFRTQVDGRFDAVDEDIRGVRRDMDKRFDAVDEDIRGVRRDMDERFDAVDGQFEAVREDVRGVGRDIDGLGNSFRREVRASPAFAVCTLSVNPLLTALILPPRSLIG